MDAFLKFGNSTKFFAPIIHYQIQKEILILFITGKVSPILTFPFQQENKEEKKRYLMEIWILKPLFIREEI